MQDVMVLTHLTRRLEGLLGPNLRFAYLTDWWRKRSLEEVVETLALAFGTRNIEEFMLLSLLILAGPDASAFRREAIAGEARRRGLTAVATLLTPRPATVPDFSARPMPYNVGRPLTLGERKSLARGKDRALLARVLRDPHPDVIAILLANPHLTERDIVRLAARRPIDGEVLKTLLRSLSWVVRYDVRKALLQNPFMPLDLAVPLVASVRQPDLGELARTQSLRPAIRDAARELAGSTAPH